MTEPTHDDDRTHAEEPAEGAVRPGETDTPDREHSQEPAEGPDDEWLPRAAR